MFGFTDVLKLHKPYIIEENEFNWTLYYSDTHVTEVKPSNWKALMRMVNEDRDPIDPRLVEAIGQATCLTFDAFNPWPTISALKDFEMRLATDVQNGVLLKQAGTIVPFIYSAEQICRKYARIVQNRVACFAGALFPNTINMADPWLGLMQMKSVTLYHDSVYHVIDIVNANGNKRAANCPKGAGYLVLHYNARTVPPCCKTAWTPFYTVEEALRVLEQVYGNPALFGKLEIAEGKLRRTP